MFGYVRPLKAELKVRDYELFKSEYCGLCSTLKKNYGFIARFTLSYELTFLAMILDAGQQNSEFEYRRCVASPHRKKRCCISSASLETAAGFNVILTKHKLSDQVCDSKGIEKFKAVLAGFLLNGAYRKACRAYPEFSKRVAALLLELSDIEKNKNGTIDAAADKFALIISSAASESDGSRLVIEQLLYHLGRWIYIVDACDDLEQDMADGRFNALRLRFDLDGGALSQENKETLAITLRHSANLVISAFQLLPEGIWTDILSNIIYLGLPAVSSSVLAGTWGKGKSDKNPHSAGIKA